jgi:general secretion pathway protein K
LRDERGFALVLTLIITALLVALLVEFVNEVYVDTSSRHNFVAAQQASILADSGFSGGVKMLQVILSNQSYSSLSDRWAKPLSLEEEKGTLQITIEEENAKLNFNRVALPNGTFDEAYHGMATRLMKRLGLSPDLCDALADWVDEDETPHPAGAETVWYATLKPPYGAKNARLETLEELGLIKGFAGAVLEKLRPFVTVYADSPVSPAAPININTAPAEVLLALHEQMNEELAARIIDYRTTTPFKYPADLAKVAGMETIATALQTRIITKGNVYRIHSQARAGETIRMVESVVRINGMQATVLYWREY